MRLRKLKKSDAPLMLEWMHDENVTEWLIKNFKAMTLQDCELFICNSLEDNNNVHLAVVDDNDEYMGTVSLKNIDKVNSCAEFAVTVRSKAMGKGFSAFAMKEMISFAFNEINLKVVYWFVSKKNIRAIRFYDKNGYKRATEEFSRSIFTQDMLNNYIVYNEINNKQI